MSSYLTYPNPSANAQNSFTQETFDRLTSHLMSWRQAPGAFGSVHLHPCWGTISSLERKYHGQTSWTIPAELEVATRLYDATGEMRWLCLAGDIVSNLLYLQTRSGGFFHASFEYEPTYECELSCPIHQALPLQALFHYYEWPHAVPQLKEQIRPALDRHHEWMARYWWKRGNASEAPLPRPGWCGVTNQDLAQVAALAEYGRVFGDMSRYEEYGRPTLDAYLSPALYLEEFGLFLRGDYHPEPAYVERTFYYGIILTLLRTIHRATGDKRIPAICDNVTRHLFDAMVKGPDGRDHLAWNIQLEENEDRNGWRIASRSTRPLSLPGYPNLLEPMREYADRTGNPALLDQISRLENTLASYVFTDGTLPSSLDRDLPLMQVVPSALLPEFWAYLARRLGRELRSPSCDARLLVARSYEDMHWRESEWAWSLSKGDTRLFTGIKSNPGAVFIGEEKPANLPRESFTGDAILEKVIFSEVESAILA